MSKHKSEDYKISPVNYYINYFEFAYNKKIYNYNKNRTKKLKNYK